MSSKLHFCSIGLMALLCAGSLACGHKAEPFPPPLENPAPTTDLKVQQRGRTALLTFAYPQTTVSGGALESLDRIHVYRTQKDLTALFGSDPVSDDAEEDAAQESQTEGEEGGEVTPEASDSDVSTDADEPGDAEDDSEDGADDEPEVPEQPLEVLAATDPAEFVATAKLAMTVSAAEIEQATEGDKLTIAIELDEAGHEEVAHTFAVQTFAPGDLASAYSNLATLVQRTAPLPPSDFQLTAEADGIRLSWAEVAEDAEEPVSIRVYRRPAQSRLYGQALSRVAGSSTEFVDRTAVFGERYIYAVTALSSELPVVESFFGGEREIDYADRFAPTPPENLIALAEAGRVRLLWDPSPEDDVVGYVVFRRQAGADFRRITDAPIVEVEFSDRNVQAGATYDYRIAAVDRVGNQSEPGTSVIARVP